MKAQTNNTSKPIIPSVFNAEVSLAALATTSVKISESLDQLVKAVYQLVDATYSNNVQQLEKEIEQVHRSLPTNWDALHEISGALNEILKETQKRFSR